MHLRRLQLVNFRNYRELTLDLTPGRLLFVGDNAQGKSNLLEAVQLLSTARSVRAGADIEMIGWQNESDAQPFARVLADVDRRSGPVGLEVLVAGPAVSSQAPARGGKRFRVNGIPRRGIDLVGQLRSVLFTADDLEIVTGGPSVRRQFLDTALTQLDRAYYGSLQRYGRILQQRNASLRRIKEGIAGTDELMLWDDTLAKEAAVIIAARREAVSILSKTAAVAQRELSGAASEELSIAYEPQVGDELKRLLPAAATPAAVQSMFTAALTSNRRRDIAAGVSLVGPHRDDVSILLNGVAASAFGSRAQIRTVALAMRLGEARLLSGDGGDPPVLLLDDIVSELDESRRRSVLAGVSAFDQVWFTATTASWLPQEFLEGAKAYRVERGAVVEG